MKAWRVYPRDDLYLGEGYRTGYCMSVVNAATRAQAITHSSLYGTYTFTELRAVRVREFDDKPLTPRTYLEAGWEYACAHCDMMLTIDGPAGWEDHQHAAPGVVYDRGGMPYCSQRCLDAARREGGGAQ
jgi:hypothetical protein